MATRTRRTKRRFRAGLPSVVRIDGQVYDAVADNLGRDSVSLYGDFPIPETDSVETTIRSTSGDLHVSAAGTLVGAVRDDEYAETHISLRFDALPEPRLALSLRSMLAAS